MSTSLASLGRCRKSSSRFAASFGRLHPMPKKLSSIRSRRLCCTETWCIFPPLPNTLGFIPCRPRSRDFRRNSRRIRVRKVGTVSARSENPVPSDQEDRKVQGQRSSRSGLRPEKVVAWKLRNAMIGRSEGSGVFDAETRNSRNFEEDMRVLRCGGKPCASYLKHC